VKPFSERTRAAYQDEIDKVANRTPIYSAMTEGDTVHVRKPSHTRDLARGGDRPSWSGVIRVSDLDLDREAYIPLRVTAAEHFRDALIATVNASTLWQLPDDPFATKPAHVDTYGVQSPYLGTVPRAITTKRRADNKAARKARRRNR
jgi:hypothetical protein